MNPKHYLVRLSGDLYAGASLWSIGLRFKPATGDGDDAGYDVIKQHLETRALGIRALHANEVFPSNVQNAMSAATNLSSIRCSYVGTDGKEIAVSEVSSASLTRGTGTAKLPSQVALAMTLRTRQPGSSYRGRVYLPALGVVSNGFGVIDSDKCDTIATEFAQFIRDVGSAAASPATPQWIPVVVSTTKNASTEITACNVGNHFDIQRRRANQKDEAYSVSAIPQ